MGLPLAIALADRGARVGIYDVSQSAVAVVNGGGLPFAEPGAADVLKRVVAEGRLAAWVSPEIVATAEHVVVVIGTPVDEHLNPDQQAKFQTLREQFRRRLIATMASEAAGKVQAAAKEDIEALKEKLGGAWMGR